MIELVDFNEIYGKGVKAAAEPAKKTRRAGGAKKKAAETTEAVEAPAEDAATGEEKAEA
jgi:large subunit ribosomal protein L17